MKAVRKLFASLALAVAIIAPVWAGDLNSTPTNASPHAPCVPTPPAATPPADFSGDEVAPSIDFDASAFALDLLKTMLSIH